MQSLSRQSDTGELIEQYGHVIVDECHHLSAVSFEALLKRARAKYVLGLTATPIRRDGQHPIIFMQCGPIRHTASRPDTAPHDLEVIPRIQSATIDLSAEAGIQDVFRHVATDPRRTAAIGSEVVSALSSGRKILVLTERTEHVPDREAVWVRRLFEKAVGGFYQVNLAVDRWRVKTGRTLNWQLSGKTDGIDDVLPTMQTDIMLDHVPTRRRIVIDTKFTSIVTKGWYRDETLKSGYVYQIYAYLFSQTGQGDAYADRAGGLLLHPAVHAHIDETVVIQHHTIRFGTVDLAAKSSEIKAQLLSFAAVEAYASPKPARPPD
jgi:hypothetical protein